MGKSKERRTSRQKSQRALEDAKRLRFEPKVFPQQEVVLMPGEIQEVESPKPIHISSFPQDLPQSENMELQLLERHIATGEAPSGYSDEVLRYDLEEISVAIVRGIRSWKKDLHL